MPRALCGDDVIGIYWLFCYSNSRTALLARHLSTCFVSVVLGLMMMTGLYFNKNQVRAAPLTIII